VHPRSLASITTVGLLLLLLLIVVVTTAGAFTPPEGSVDWVGGFVEGIGYGTARPTGNRPGDRINAIRAAEVMAQRALAETIHGVRVDGETLMGDAVKRYVLESRVQGLVRGARKVKETVEWDGKVPSATVTLRICIVADAPGCETSSTLVGIMSAGKRPEPAYVPATFFGEGTSGGDKALPIEKEISYDSSRPVTGLVLDLRVRGHMRELFPVVAAFGEKGSLEKVFSAKSVLPEIIRTFGVARYADSLPQAKENERVGDNPLVVPVGEVTPDNLLVVHREAARIIRETTRYGNDYLAKAKVVIAGK